MGVHYTLPSQSQESKYFLIDSEKPDIKHYHLFNIFRNCVWYQVTKQDVIKWEQ